MSQSTTYKVTVLENVSLKTPKITDNKVKSSTDKDITLPAEGTLATIDGSETFTNKTLTTPSISSIINGNATLTLPTTTGTVALTSDITNSSDTLTAAVNAQKDRIDRLLNYLSTWINVGNLTMSDIKTAVDPSS